MTLTLTAVEFDAAREALRSEVRAFIPEALSNGTFDPTVTAGWWRQDDLVETACAIERARLVPAFGGPWNVLTAGRTD
jgi:hypothetical protein